MAHKSIPHANSYLIFPNFLLKYVISFPLYIYGHKDCPQNWKCYSPHEYIILISDQQRIVMTWIQIFLYQIILDNA